MKISTSGLQMYVYGQAGVSASVHMYMCAHTHKIIVAIYNK